MSSKSSAAKISVLALYTALMLYAAWTPPLELPILISDKWLHAVEFFLLFWLVRRVFSFPAWIFIYGALMALTTEGLQFFTVQRTPELLDLAADAAGYLAAAFTFYAMNRKGIRA